MALKNLKRNLIIATVLLFVAAAVYLNWSYNNKVSGTPDSAMVAAEDDMTAQAAGEDSASGGTQLAVSSPAAGAGTADASADGVSTADASTDGVSTADASTDGTSPSDYFALARLTRQQSRDQSLGLLQQAAAAQNASQNVIDDAVNQISVMATRTMKEAQLENLLIAKDFADCVVFMTDTDVTVAIPAPAEGLSEAAVARVTDTITSETDYDATQIKLIEVKAQDG